MFKIKTIDKIKWAKKAKPVAKRILSSKEEQARFISMLKNGGYPELAEIAEDAKKYIPEAKKSLA